MLAPKSWLDITVSQFKELYLLEEETLDDYTSYLSILLDKSIDEIEELDIDIYESLLNDLTWTNIPPNKEPRPTIITDAGILHLKDNFTELTFGEFIDLENLFTDGYIKNLELLLTIFYRVKEDKQSLLHQDNFEPYGNYIFHRKNLFDNVSIEYIYGILTKYLNFRTELFDKYQGLFDTKEEEEEIDPELIKDKKAHKEQEREKDNTSKWGWGIVLLRLANNDITKIEQITEMNLLLALNVLSMRKELKIGEN